jgi:hypothetical protein
VWNPLTHKLPGLRSPTQTNIKKHIIKIQTKSTQRNLYSNGDPSWSMRLDIFL